MRSRILLLIFFFIAASGTAYGQKANKKITIAGKVTDANHQQVPGAIIFIDKIKTDIVTDDQGYYKIKVRSDAKEIMAFTLLKGVSEEIINGRTTIDFILPGGSGGKGNVTDNHPVNTGKEISERKDINPDIKVFDPQDARNATYQTVYDMIRGRFPGVEVSGKSIRIMGSSSLNVSTEPLFVVDGTIVNSLEDISPQMVKSIEVLKGPDASVYGTRGSNGVIVITRLTGKDRIK